MSSSPHAIFLFPYIETAIELIALSAAPVLLLFCALERRAPRDRHPASQHDLARDGDAGLP